MRLTLQTQQIIKNSVQETFGVDAKVKIFGSRLNNHRLKPVGSSNGLKVRIRVD